MENYSNSKIYKIISKNTKKIYIGSTVRTLKHRLCMHIKDFKHNNYCSSKELILLGDYEIVLIESYSCKNKNQLRIREQFWINKFKFDGYQLVNKRKAYISEEELKERNKQYKKKYYLDNKKEISLKYKQYWKQNKNNLKQRNIKYTQEHKKEIKQYQKEYRRENKNGYKQYQKEYWRENKIFQKRSVVKLMSDFINEIQDF